MFQRENKFPWVTVIFGVLASLGIVYMIIDVKMTLDNQQKAREFGQQEGLQMVVSQAIDLAEQCQDIPLVMGDKQIVVRNVSCPAQTPTETLQENVTIEE